MLKEYIKSKEAEFDQIFPNNPITTKKLRFEDLEKLPPGSIIPLGKTISVKEFLTSSLTGLLDEIEKEVEMMKKTGNPIGVNILARKSDDEINKEIIYNQTLEEVAALLKKERGDVTK